MGDVAAKTVLIVDDDTELTDVLRDKFSAAGFETLIAHNGEEGLHTALDKHPDIILLDVTMPVMSGSDMLVKLRADEWGADVPVIALTNVDDSAHISEILDHGCRDYLVKTDWDLDAIVKQVKMRLHEHLGGPSLSGT